MFRVAALLVRKTEAIEIANPQRSENIWAASVMIDRELAIYPPTTSANMNNTQTIETQTNFLMACF